MKQYLLLLFALLLIIGSGCHKASPTEPQNPPPQDSIPLYVHYPTVTVKFSNILMSNQHTDDPFPSKSGTKYDTRDTTLRSSSDFLWSNAGYTIGPSFDQVVLTLDSTDKFIASQNLIPTLSAYFSLNGSPWLQDKSILLKDIKFIYGSDSSIIILLNGSDANNHFGGLNDSYGYQSYQSFGVTYSETNAFDYYKCTDSTQIEITLPYKK
jgi:hypothetical protein